MFASAAFLRFWTSVARSPHCAFSPNLFHGQITQKSIDQMCSPENKKCSPWKVFGINHAQTLQLLSRRGPRGPDVRLFQHYIGPILSFFNFLQKKVSRLDKKVPAHFCITLGAVIWKNHVAKPLDSFNKCKKKIFSNFSCRFLNPNIFFKFEL